MLTLDQIKQHVRDGKRVHWMNPAYTVILDSVGQWLIAYRHGHSNANYIGLTWRDGVTMNGDPADFYLADKESSK